ncbi:MAG: 50S ribosomal protein L18 [Candidatus Zixiibacteriota bacterium]|nr:MAG: 50S ribosomal protein L18 [candidate division Zixibacteria bacterium]
MKSKNEVKTAKRLRRKKHIQKVVRGTAERPRLVVYRSLNEIYAQLVDDQTGRVITGLSSRTPTLKADMESAQGKVNQSRAVGKALAASAREKGIEKVVFDRNGYLYHGRIKAVAEGAREGGLIL